MNLKPGLHGSLRIGGTIFLTGSVMLFSACASAPPPPSASIDAASSSIANAERANAGRFAAAELGQAREKLAQANTAVAEKDMIAAERLADESKVSADLAYARTEASKAATINKEMNLGAEALTEEMQRAGDQR